MVSHLLQRFALCPALKRPAATAWPVAVDPDALVAERGGAHKGFNQGRGQGNRDRTTAQFGESLPLAGINPFKFLVDELLIATGFVPQFGERAKVFHPWLAFRRARKTRGPQRLFCFFVQFLCCDSRPAF